MAFLRGIITVTSIGVINTYALARAGTFGTTDINLNNTPDVSYSNIDYHNYYVFERVSYDETSTNVVLYAPDNPIIVPRIKLSILPIKIAQDK